MTPKPNSAAKAPRRGPAGAPPIHVAIVTLDGHFAAVAGRTAQALAGEIPGLRLSLHAAAEWAANPPALARCKAAIAEADSVAASILFMDDNLQPVLPALQARRESRDAISRRSPARAALNSTNLGHWQKPPEGKGATAPLTR